MAITFLNKIVATFMILAIIISFMPNFSRADDTDITFTFSDNYGTLTFSGNGKITGEIVKQATDYRANKILEELRTAQENGTVYEYEALEKIVIKEGITGIGSYAFTNRFDLTNIEIPNGVTEIETCAFSECTKLSDVKLPYRVSYLGSSIFEYCSSLDNIEIPDGWTVIPGGMFFGCTSLKNIKIPESIEKIETSAFKGCTRLNTLDIPETVKQIGDEVFSRVF